MSAKVTANNTESVLASITVTLTIILFRISSAEEKIRALEIDKESILAANASETSSLRAAHSKALETLMSYQEENDMLRAAVAEMASAESKGNSGAVNAKKSGQSTTIGSTTPIISTPRGQNFK